MLTKKDILKSSFGVSNEAIDFQDTSFHGKLSDLIGRFRKKHPNGNPGSKIKEDALLTMGIGKLMKERFNINISVFVHSANFVNAWIHIPDLNKNNPILNDGTWFNQQEIKYLMEDREEVDVVMDLKNARVGEGWSKLNVAINVTVGMLFLRENGVNGKFVMTDEEISAVILHEIGHLFSFLESMTRTLKRNWILESHLKDFVRKGNTKLERAKIITDLKARKLLGKDFDSSVVLEASKSKGSILILTEYNRTINEDPYSLFHNLTAFESASDQFATRMGAGEDIVTGLTKIHNNYKVISTFYYLVLLHWEIGRYGFLLALCTGVFGTAIWPIIIGVITFFNLLHLGLSFHLDPYDKPKDRLHRVRNEMQAALKDKNLPEEHKKTLLRGIKTTDETIKERWWILRENRTISSYVVQWMFEFVGKNRETKLLQQDVEDLVNNDLYAKAAEFSILKNGEV